MYKPILICTLFLVSGVVSGIAQTSVRQSSESYELILQMVIADNSNTKSAIAPKMAETVRKLKTIYGFSDYRLGAAMYARSGGTVENKGVVPILAAGDPAGAPAFAEWSMRVTGRTAEAQSPRSVEVEGFRFNVRIPVALPNADEKSGARVVYESIGFSSGRFSLPENEPTLVGSLSAGKPGEMMFVVLTVNSNP